MTRAGSQPHGHLVGWKASSTTPTRSRWTRSGAVITSDSTLRFRDRGEVESSLAAAGYRVRDMRDAPERPGREFVFLADRGIRQ
jgi:hypothetical protein